MPSQAEKKKTQETWGEDRVGGKGKKNEKI